MKAKALNRDGGKPGRSLATAPQPAPVSRPLSNLDGPLHQLLETRNQAELQLARAKLNVERFLSACGVITAEASGRLIERRDLPPEVQAYIRQIEFRASARAVKFA